MLILFALKKGFREGGKKGPHWELNPGPPANWLPKAGIILLDHKASRLIQVVQALNIKFLKAQGFGSACHLFWSHSCGVRSIV